MRVTSKGQVTIPQEVRKRLGIEAGSEVDFVWHDEGVVLVRREHDEPEDWVDAMVARARGLTLMSADEAYALLRDDE